MHQQQLGRAAAAAEEEDPGAFPSGQGATLRRSGLELSRDLIPLYRDPPPHALTGRIH
jgi:hypothetical protein